MNSAKRYKECPSCEDILAGIDAKLIQIADNKLYNSRYELNREVDTELFNLLVFYKKILIDIFDEVDCDCYTIPEPIQYECDDCPNTGFSDTVINHCICGCCPPEKIVCSKPYNEDKLVTKENIIERVKVLIA